MDKWFCFYKASSLHNLRQYKDIYVDYNDVDEDYAGTIMAVDFNGVEHMIFIGSPTEAQNHFSKITTLLGA